MLAPPTPANVAAFEAWSGSERQASAFLGDALQGCQRITLRRGDTLFLPSAWPHAVSTPEDSIVVGGNYLHQLDFAATVDVYEREQRLGVQPKFQFPLFRRLMWHAAAAADARLEHAERAGVSLEACGLTPWEVKGLPALVGMLRRWRAQPGGGRRQDVPGDLLPDPGAFLNELDRRAAAAAHRLRPGLLGNGDAFEAYGPVDEGLLGQGRELGGGLSIPEFGEGAFEVSGPCTLFGDIYIYLW